MPSAAATPFAVLVRVSSRAARLRFRRGKSSSDAWIAGDAHETTVHETPTSPIMPDLRHLLAGNRAWAARIAETDPDIFRRMAKGQNPEILWIGCSDSRVSATQVLDLPPGRVFVHRNIANLVVPDDENCLSVLQYAVEALDVRHMVVCGHYGCGGIRASLGNSAQGPIRQRIEHVRRVRRLHREELADLEGVALERRLVELNVVEQVRNLAATRVLRDRWREGTGPDLHGWVYEIAEGLLKPLCRQSGGGALVPA